MQIRFTRLLCLAGLLVLDLSGQSSAAVVRWQIDRREPFAEGHPFGSAGPYESLSGRMFLEVDPEEPANERIVDLRLAPRNQRGHVEFWSDFFLLKPVDPNRGNRRLLYDVNNRGNKLALGAFNGRGGNAPTTLADAGNGFLMRQGYSIFWSGWNGDVRAGDQRLLAGLPVATENGRELTAPVYSEIVVNQPSFSEPFAWGNTDPYPSVTLDHRSARLTMRPNRSQPPQAVPHDDWAFARLENNESVPDPRHLYLKAGFRPGWIYELVYTATGPRVTGLGLAAVRDTVSFLRYAAADTSGQTNPLAGSIDFAYAFGISQSGRLIHHLIYEGFHVDERQRVVFDGAIDHVGGGGRGYFNHRFAQTTRHGSPHEDNLAPSDLFPFTTTPQYDPATGERGDTLARARSAGAVPKLFFTCTSTEYWTRAASLLHTDVDGLEDIEPDPNVRIYFISGGQHGVSQSPERGIYQNPVNTLDHRPVLRAVLVQLDRWVSAGSPPPASRIPRIADGTLVSLAAYQASFPRIPGVSPPATLYVPARLDFGPRWRDTGIAEFVPPRVGKPYCTLVPAIDSDGNEIAGIRLPDVAVPTAAYTGWNLRSESAGAAGALGRWNGSLLRFPITAEARRSQGDPRPAVVERYPHRDTYLARFARAAVELSDAGFLLDEDVVDLIKIAATRDFWDQSPSP